jgi:hypothetical protein
MQNQIDSQHNIQRKKKPDVVSLEFVKKIQEERKKLASKSQEKAVC